MSLTNCRFYEEKYPEVDSYVMVNVKQVRGFDFPLMSAWHILTMTVGRSPRWAHT